MNICVELLARLLEADEREAVLGDLAELNDSGMKAFRAVAGLLLRRQLAVWKDWLGVAGLVGVVCPMLLIVTVGVMSPVLVNIRTYLRVGSPYSSGLTSAEEFSRWVTGAIGLLFWSWTSGLVLAYLSRKTLWITGKLYFAIAAPLFLSWMCAHFPVALLLVAAHLGLFVYPSINGFRYGLRHHALAAREATLLTSVILCVTGLSVWMGGWPQAAVARWAGGAWNPSPGWPHRLFFYGALAWPVIYLLVTAKGSPFAKMKGHGEFRG